MCGNAESKSISVRGGRRIVKITDVAMKTNLTCKYLYDNFLVFFIFFIEFFSVSGDFFLSSPQRLRVLSSVLVVYSIHWFVDASSFRTPTPLEFIVPGSRF